MVQFVKRVTKMNEHQVALMTEHGEKSALMRGGFLHFLEDGGGFVHDLLAVPVRKFAPIGPAEPHHLVQDAGALNREWHLRHLGATNFRRSISGHRNPRSSF